MDHLSTILSFYTHAGKGMGVIALCEEVSASATQVTEALATTRADTEEMSAINENLIEAISFFNME